MRPAQRNMYGQPPAGMRYSPSPSHLHLPLQPGHGRGHAVAQTPEQAQPHMQHQLYRSMLPMGMMIPMGSSSNAGIPLQYDYTPSTAAREAASQQQSWSASFPQTRPQWEQPLQWQENGPRVMNPNAHLYAYHMPPESNGDRGFGNGRRSNDLTGMGSGRGMFGARHVSLSPELQPSPSQPFEAPVVLQAKSLRCEPCDKTFDVLSQMKAHMSSHVPCDEPSCSFSASGKMVKEHKQLVHGKQNAPLSMKVLKAAALCLKEGEDEIRRWCEERKRNYPTTSNIRRKAEDRQARKARGELMDEDARIRRQRLKEVLQRQAELGVPVAEIPSHYISDHYARDHRKLSRNNQNGTENVAPAQNTPSDQVSTQVNGVKRERNPRAETCETQAEENGERPSKIAHLDVDPLDTVDGSSPLLPELSLLKNSSGEISDDGTKCIKENESTDGVPGSGAFYDLSNRKSTGMPEQTHRSSEQPCYFFQRGRCKKGSRCHFVHDRQLRRKGGEDRANNTRGKGKQKGASSGTVRPSSLLSRLLDSSVRADKSHILQCLRFFVKNSFLLEWPTKPVEFSDWLEDDAGSSDIAEREALPPLDVLAADAALVASGVEIDDVEPGNWEEPAGQPESSNEEK